MFERLVNTIHKHDKRVALLTMAYNPQLYYRKIFHSLWQIYPHHLKTLMLLYQPDPVSHVFPTPIVNDMPFEIVQQNIDKQWPEAWMFKMQAAIKIAEDRKIDIIVIYDEDDEYPPWWIECCVNAIVDNKVDAVWTFYNIDAKGGEVLSFEKPRPYDAPSGAMAIKTTALSSAFAQLISKYPLGKSHAGATGTKDMSLCKIIHADCKVWNLEIDPMKMRGYVRYSMANTKKRRFEDDIDFGFNGKNTEKRYAIEPERIGKGLKRRQAMMSNQLKKTTKKKKKTRLRRAR